MENIEEEVCPICYDTIGNTNKMILECSHTYHTTCGITWLRTHNTCPTCRIEVYENENQTELENNNNPVDENTFDYLVQQAMNFQMIQNNNESINTTNNNFTSTPALRTPYIRFNSFVFDEITPPINQNYYENLRRRINVNFRQYIRDNNLLRDGSYNITLNNQNVDVPENESLLGNLTDNNITENELPLGNSTDNNITENELSLGNSTDNNITENELVLDS